jgi:hypothetical protein
MTPSQSSTTGIRRREMNVRDQILVNLALEAGYRNTFHERCGISETWGFRHEENGSHQVEFYAYGKAQKFFESIVREMQNKAKVKTLENLAHPLGYTVKYQEKTKKWGCVYDKSGADFNFHSYEDALSFFRVVKTSRRTFRRNSCRSRLALQDVLRNREDPPEDYLGLPKFSTPRAEIRTILDRLLNHSLTKNAAVEYLYQMVIDPEYKEDDAPFCKCSEPVKSRFHTIVNLEVNTEDWVSWALQNNMP